MASLSPCLWTCLCRCLLLLLTFYFEKETLNFQKSSETSGLESALLHLDRRADSAWTRLLPPPLPSCAYRCPLCGLRESWQCTPCRPLQTLHPHPLTALHTAHDQSSRPGHWRRPSCHLTLPTGPHSVPQVSGSPPGVGSPPQPGPSDPSSLASDLARAGSPPQSPSVRGHPSTGAGGWDGAQAQVHCHCRV